MGKKSGPEVVKTELPPEIEAQALANLDIARQAANIGYTPYQGPTVAGFSPQEIAGMQGINDAASAFGMPSAQPQPQSGQSMYEMLTGVPEPNSSVGGFQGYSSMPLYNQAIEQMAPGQRAAIDSFSIDPLTGAPPANPALASAGMVNPAATDIDHNMKVPVKYGRTDAEKDAIRARNKEIRQAKKARAIQAAEDAKTPAQGPSWLSNYNLGSNMTISR